MLTLLPALFNYRVFACLLLLWLLLLLENAIKLNEINNSLK